MSALREQWFYGADASFPKAVQWHTWFDYWKTRYAASQPWERFLVDATMKLQQVYVKVAQQMRKNPDWTRTCAESTIRNILDLADEAKSWYDRNRPRNFEVSALDPRLVILFEALDGAYAVALRLARELDTLNRKGYLLVDMSDEAHEVLAPRAS